MKKVLIAMSGGVDSAVTAYLLKEQGYDCVGVMMRLHESATDENRDVDDARATADKLGISFHVHDLTKEFKEQVIERFVRAYEQGLTPNPCVNCNRDMKFGKLFEYAAELGCSHVATGHYARVVYAPDKGRWLLKKGKDESKDQSYVLYNLTQEQLARTLLPLGEYDKEQVRALAVAHGLVNPNRPDSQDICFIPGGDYVQFLTDYRGSQYPPGKFIDKHGEELGEHKGIVRYTVGQRKGLGVSHSEKLFVSAKSAEDNTVTLVEKADLVTHSLIADELNLIDRERLAEPTRVAVRTRYHQVERAAVVEQLDDTSIRVSFVHPHGAVAPGQSVVMYDGDVVVGGATILRAE